MNVSATPISRLAFKSKAELAQALGVSEDFIERHVWQELRVVRRGRFCFVAITEVQRWLDANAELVLVGRDESRVTSST